MLDLNKVRGVVRYELRMRWRSWRYWIAFLMAGALALYVPTPLNYPGPEDGSKFVSSWWMAGQAFSGLTLLMTLLAAFLVADRIVRDATLRTKESIKVRAVAEAEYVLGKYLASLIALALIAGSVFVGIPITKWVITGTLMSLWPLLIAFMTMYLPPMAFVTALALTVTTLLGDSLLFYVPYAVLWFFDSMRFRPLSSWVRGVFNFSGGSSFQAFFSDVALFRAGDPQISPGVVAANIFFLLLTSALLLAVLVSFEKRRGEHGAELESRKDKRWL